MMKVPPPLNEVSGGLAELKFETFGLVGGKVPEFEALTMIAKSATSGEEVGRVVFEYGPCTKASYVFDLIVEDPYKKLGLATKLLEEVWRVTACEELVPVDIVKAAKPFWLLVAERGVLPIRLGMREKEMKVLKWAMSARRPIMGMAQQTET